MGIETPHNSDFVINCPTGMGVCAFLMTLSPCFVSVEYDGTGDPDMPDPRPDSVDPDNRGGMRYLYADRERPACAMSIKEMRAGECIIYTDTFPRHLTIDPSVTNLRNNWIHFRCDDPAALLSGYGIPANRLFALRTPTLITSQLYDIMSEHLQMNPHWERMEQLMLDELLILIARNVMPAHTPLPDKEQQHYDAMERLRKKIYINPERDWNVASMAEGMFMTQNRFIMLYSSFFGVTPKRDVINARVQQAKLMLKMERLSIREVAYRTGFQNEYYFGNTFKRFTGMTPAAYRDQNVK